MDKEVDCDYNHEIVTYDNGEFVATDTFDKDIENFTVLKEDPIWVNSKLMILLDVLSCSFPLKVFLYNKSKKASVIIKKKIYYEEPPTAFPEPITVIALSDNKDDVVVNGAIQESLEEEQRTLDLFSLKERYERNSLE